MSLFNELKRRNVLRVALAYLAISWLLVQVVETLFPVFELSNASIKLVVIVLAIGFPLSLIFSWLYELTPDGLKLEKDVDRSSSELHHTGKKLDRAIIIVLALALGYFAFDKFVLAPDRNVEHVATARQLGRSEALVESYGEKSIAVLAFEDMSQNKDQEYLSDGIAEELLNLLTRIPELRVISRSSAFSFKGKDIKLAQVAEELNVAHILEGSVRKAGNRVRITVQLIEARSDTHLWSQTYDRTLDDIFAIQDEIAATVVEQLKVTLLGNVPKVQETSPEAHDLYLQAKHVAGRLTIEGWELASELFQQVLVLDPGYVAAWHGLASVHNNLANAGGYADEEGWAQARETAEKVLLIAPDSAEAHINLGYISMTQDGDLAVAARHYMRARALEPTNPKVIGNAAILMQYLGRWEQAIALHQYAIDRNPLGTSGYINLGRSYLSAGRWDESIATTRAGLRLSPGYIYGNYTIAEALLLKGEPEAGLAAMPQSTGTGDGLEGLREAVQLMAYHALGQAEASDAVLAELIEKWGRADAYYYAKYLAYRNEADRAFEWLDKAFKDGSPNLDDINRHPLFTNIYNDPRWLPLLESVGRSPAQLDAIEFKVTLPSK